MISCRFCVATYPGVQDRLAAELDAAGLLATPSNPEPKELDFNIMNELPVMDAVSLSLTLPDCGAVHVQCWIQHCYQCLFSHGAVLARLALSPHGLGPSS